MIAAAKLAVEINADTGAAERGLRGISGMIDNLAGKGTILSQVFGGMLAATAIREAASGFMQLSRDALTAYSNYEMLGQSMRSLAAREMMNAGVAGSMSQALEMAGDKARELLNWTQKLAIESPYTQAGVAATYRQALAYGFTSDQAKRMTQAMIDYATATGQGEDAMQRAALALGQIQAKGKLAGQEVLQLVNAGIPVDTILARAFGRTTAEIVKMREEGVIPADKAIQAIIQSIEEDFGGAGKRAAGTFAGLLSTLNDIKEVGLREYFGAAFQDIQPKLQAFVETFQKPETIEKIRQWGKGLAVTIDKVVTNGEKLITWFTNLEQSSRDLVIGLGALILVGPNLINFFGGVSKAATLALPGIIDFFAAWKAGMSLTTVLGAAGLSPVAIGFTAVTLAAAAAAAAIYSYNENIVKTNRQGIEGVSHGITQVAKGTRSAADAVANFRYQMQTINTETNPFAQKDFISGIAAVFVDKSQMQKVAIDQLQNSLIATTQSYEEYRKKLVEAYQAAGIWTSVTAETGITLAGSTRVWTQAEYEAEIQAIRLRAAMDGLKYSPRMWG